MQLREVHPSCPGKKTKNSQLHTSCSNWKHLVSRYWAQREQGDEEAGGTTEDCARIALGWLLKIGNTLNRRQRRHCFFAIFTGLFLLSLLSLLVFHKAWLQWSRGFVPTRTPRPITPAMQTPRDQLKSAAKRVKVGKMSCVYCVHCVLCLMLGHLKSFCTQPACSWIMEQERHVSLRVKNLRFLASLNEEALRTQARCNLFNLIKTQICCHIWRTGEFFASCEARLFALLERSEGALLPEAGRNFTYSKPTLSSEGSKVETDRRGAVLQEPE